MFISTSLVTTYFRHQLKTKELQSYQGHSGPVSPGGDPECTDISVTVWNCSTTLFRLDRVVCVASKTIVDDLPSVSTIYVHNMGKIGADESHPANVLFCSLASGVRYRHVQVRTFP